MPIFAIFFVIVAGIATDWGEPNQKNKEKQELNELVYGQLIIK